MRVCVRRLGPPRESVTDMMPLRTPALMEIISARFAFLF